MKTETMLENAKPLSADALVLIVGANDYSNDVPFAQTVANITGMVQKTGAPRVIIYAVPPNDETPELTVEFNANLQKLAAANGWTFIDGPAGIRTANNTYASGMTADGVHPTADGARILGEAMRAALLQP